MLGPTQAHADGLEGALPEVEPTPSVSLQNGFVFLFGSAKPYHTSFFLVSDIGRKVGQMPSPLLCPVCKSPAQELDGDATGFHCPIDGKFKVADTIIPEDYTRQQWEVALKKAQLRTKQGECPVVRLRDFNQ